MGTDGETRSVVIVGGGFAGVACARELAAGDGVHVTLVDRNNYHQFQPLLYQVATSQLASSDIAVSLRTFATGSDRLEVKLGEAVAVDPESRTMTTETGESYRGDYLVLAAGSRPAFFGTPGAADHSFPLYSLDDAQRLRSRILALYEEADRDPSLLDRGALDFVIVGAGATGTEVAGALAEMIRTTMAAEYPAFDPGTARVWLVDHGDAVLGPFSERAHEYAAKVLTGDGVELRLGTGVTEVGPGHVTLSDGSTIESRCVVWGGGLEAAALAGRAGLPQGRGGRIDVAPDLTVAGYPAVYAIGDFANIPAADGKVYPQLGSVAQQAGRWAARNIRDEIAGTERKPFEYRDKGVMAMIGRGAAVAEVGSGHHELEGSIAFAAWLGVHLTLLSGVRNRTHAFIEWAWDYFSESRGPQVLDRSDAARIDWGDE